MILICNFQAHVLKNFDRWITKILSSKDVKLIGTGKSKMQGDILRDLCKTIRFYANLAFKGMDNITDEDEKIQHGLLKMKACRLHITGDHSLCTHENSNCLLTAYLLQNDFENGMKWGERERNLVVKHLFTDQLETTDWVKKHLIKPGNTSHNENYHSVLVKRGLINKDSNANVFSNSIDAKYALGTLFFNLGAKDTYETLFNQDESLNWKISQYHLHKIDEYQNLKCRTNQVQMAQKKKREENKKDKQKRFNRNPRNGPGVYQSAIQKRRHNTAFFETPTAKKSKK